MYGQGKCFCIDSNPSDHEIRGKQSCLQIYIYIILSFLIFPCDLDGSETAIWGASVSTTNGVSESIVVTTVLPSPFFGTTKDALISPGRENELL